MLDGATVRRSTGPGLITYTKSAIERGSLHPGETLCVRTNGHRRALVTIINASAQAIDFGTTVWDAPVPS